jgi:hypothetical protein
MRIDGMGVRKAEEFAVLRGCRHILWRKNAHGRPLGWFGRYLRDWHQAHLRLRLGMSSTSWLFSAILCLNLQVSISLSVAGVST